MGVWRMSPAIHSTRQPSCSAARRLARAIIPASRSSRRACASAGKAWRTAQKALPLPLPTSVSVCASDRPASRAISSARDTAA